MKLGALLEQLRSRGIQRSSAAIHKAIAEGKIARPMKDTDGRYDFDAVNVNEIEAHFSKKKEC